ncbi:MAG TPA: hypothetical protein VM262_14785 [Acidimicrobiales bacterium]|nr:hypothetical protein [Acidimicrobiales bacterium]
MRTDRLRLVALALAVAALATACGDSSGGRLDLGVRRVALNLAFAVEELAEPVEPNRIIQLIPAPPEVTTPEQLAAPPPFDPPTLPDLCPEAPAGAAPRESVALEIRQPPAAGSYLRSNEGTISVTGGPFLITLPFPFISRWEIGEAETIETPAPLGIGDPAVVREYEVRKILAPGFETIERMRLLEDRLQLVSRTTINQESTTEFTPSPAIDVYVFGVEGDSWASAGMDDASGAAMLYQGRIERREIIDVCGEVIDTYRVIVSEQLVNLRTGEVSGTSGDEEHPTIFNYATHLGGLVVREEVHSTQNSRDPETGSPLVIGLDYTSTLTSTEPDGSPFG